MLYVRTIIWYIEGAISKHTCSRWGGWGIMEEAFKWRGEAYFLPLITPSQRFIVFSVSKMRTPTAYCHPAYYLDTLFAKPLCNAFHVPLSWWHVSTKKRWIGRERRDGKNDFNAGRLSKRENFSLHLLRGEGEEQRETNMEYLRQFCF